MAREKLVLVSTFESSNHTIVEEFPKHIEQYLKLSQRNFFFIFASFCLSMIIAGMATCTNALSNAIRKKKNL